MNKMLKTLTIRGQKIWPNVWLSPMAGVSDPSFRRLCKELAGGRLGMLVSEFVSVDCSTRMHASSMRRMRFYQSERPFCMQIFGADVQKMAEGARLAESLGADFVEINAGCPAPKVVGRGGGAGLMRDLPHLAKLLSAVRSALTVPLFIKSRVGWDEHSINVEDALHIAQEEGVELYSIHGRTRMQGYHGLADWKLIEKVAAKAKIPVAGNGDIHTAEQAEKRILNHGVSAVGIGRAALHDPWIFARIADRWEGLPEREFLATDHLQMFCRYAELLQEDGFNEYGALGRCKQLAARFVKCLEPAHPELRKTLLRAQGLEEFLLIAREFFEKHWIAEGYRFVPERLGNLNGKEQDEILAGNQFRTKNCAK